MALTFITFHLFFLSFTLASDTPLSPSAHKLLDASPRSFSGGTALHSEVPAAHAPRPTNRQQSHERRQLTTSMDALVERLSHPSYAVPISLLIVYSVYTRLTSTSTVPSGLPWVGKDSSKLFADTRATFASFSNVRKWLGEGYEKV